MLEHFVFMQVVESSPSDSQDPGNKVYSKLVKVCCISRPCSLERWRTLDYPSFNAGSGGEVHVRGSDGLRQWTLSISPVFSTMSMHDAQEQV
jgi:hypothetical protein